jgi:type IV secretion system protein VirB6
MAGFCAQPLPDEGLVDGLLVSVDCNVRAMSEAAYGALAQPNSPVALGLTTLLTLYIALIGYGLMVGRTPLRVSQITVSVMKVGVVLALATQWPTYQHLVFDTLFKGPEELGGLMIGAANPSGGALGDDVFSALQAAYDEMQASATLFGRGVTGLSSPLTGGAGGAALALNLSSLLLMLTSLGVILAAKIALGLLLGLGPLFATLLLFEGTKGVFEGWLRASIGFALAPLMAVLGLVVQLMMLEPHLALLADNRAQNITDFAPASAVLLLTLISTGVSLALGIAVGVIAFSLKLPSWGASAPAAAEPGSPTVTSSPVVVSSGDRGQPFEPRAAAMVAAVAAMDRREVAVQQTTTNQASSRLRVDTSNAPVGASVVTPFGQTYRRAARPGRAASTQRRDQ